MKKPILLIVLMSVFFNVTAQNHFVGINGNLSWQNVSSGDIFENSGSLMRLSGGVTYEYFINDFVSIGSGLSYEQRGFTEESLIGSGETFHFTHSYDYLSLPIKVGSYTSNRSFFGLAKAGLVPSYLINAKTAVPAIDGANNLTGKKTVNVTGEVSAFDLAGLAELGGGYNASTKIWVTASISYQHSLTSITNSNFFADESIRHQGVGLNLGLIYAL